MSARRMVVPRKVARAARDAALESDCDRLRVGAVVWQYNAIGDPVVIGAGQNRAPRGSSRNCRDDGHLMVGGHCVRPAHAEQVALASTPECSTGPRALHVTHTPCPHCVKQALEEGIHEVTWSEDYGNAEGAEAILGEATRLRWGRAEEC